MRKVIFTQFCLPLLVISTSYIALDPLLVEYTEAALRGLDLYLLSDADQCFQSIFQTLDLNLNQILNSDSTNQTTSSPLLSFTQIQSNWTAKIIAHCPFTLIDFGFNTTYQFLQFQGSTIPGVVESFIYGMLANSIKFRDIFGKIQAQYTPVANQTTSTNYVTLVEQTAKFFKSVIFFQNLYVSQSQVQSSFYKMHQIKAQTNNFVANSTQGGYFKMNTYATSVFSAGFSRLSDFYQQALGPFNQSQVKQCDQNLQQMQRRAFDMVSVYTNQTISWDNAAGYILSISTLMSQSLSLIHPLMSTCISGFQNEIENPLMYHDPVNDFFNWLYAVTVQDQRVYQNMNGIYDQVQVATKYASFNKFDSNQLISLLSNSTDVNYQKLGWYLGDIFGRLFLNFNRLQLSQSLISDDF